MASRRKQEEQEANEGTEPAQPVQGLQESFWSSVRTPLLFPGICRRRGSGVRQGAYGDGVMKRGGNRTQDCEATSYEDTGNAHRSPEPENRRKREGRKRGGTNHATQELQTNINPQVHHCPQLPRHHRQHADQGVRPAPTLSCTHQTTD